MKRRILLSGFIGMALLLTSCLEEGSSNYDEVSVAYMATDMATGRVYGRTLTGRLITSQDMQLMYPGTFQFLRYSWTEEYGTTPIYLSDTEVLQADNVVITGSPVEIEQVPLLLNQEPPEVETPDQFTAIDPPIYANDEIYLGDHWLFQYAYEAKEEETADVNFYLIEDTVETGNRVSIVIDLTIMEDSVDTSSPTTKSDILALDMSYLRALYEGSSETNTKDLEITFQYYLKGDLQRRDSQIYRMTVKGD